MLGLLVLLLRTEATGQEKIKEERNESLEAQGVLPLCTRFGRMSRIHTSSLTQLTMPAQHEGEGEGAVERLVELEG